MIFDSANVLVQLADAEVKVHMALVCRRCPFFEGLFQGRAQGQWLSGRIDSGEIRIDLKHVDSNVFRYVLRHIYADTGEELFDEAVASDLDEFLDLIIDVLSVANELMLDRLAIVCQSVIGRFGLYF
jgi:inhibitor of Bruton tyrosine kinase